LLLPVHDFHLHALRSLPKAGRRRSRSLARLRLDRLVGKGHRTPALAHLRRRRLWLLENAAMDVAMGRRLRRPGGHRDADMERRQRQRSRLAGRDFRRSAVRRAYGRPVAGETALPYGGNVSDAKANPHGTAATDTRPPAPRGRAALLIAALGVAQIVSWG